MLSKQGKISIYAFFRYYIIPEFNPWWFSIFHTIIWYSIFGYLVWKLNPFYAIPFFVLGSLSGIGRAVINTQIYSEAKTVKEGLFYRDRLEFPLLTILYLFTTVGVLFSIYKFGLSLPQQVNVTLCSVYSIYWALLVYLGQLSIDKDESKFFVHIYSPNKILWEGASIAFENGDNQFDNENFYRSFYYFWVAERRYKKLANSETKEPYKTIAELQGEAAKLSKEAILNPKESEEYFRQANEVMENVISRSKYRVCTMCGDAVKTEDCNIFVTDEGVLDKIICNACYRREEKPQSSSKTQEKKQTQQSESERRAEQKKTETTQESHRSQTSQRETQRDTSKSTDNSKTETSTTTPQRQTMTLTEAFELLKLEKDPTLTKSDVKKAFKKQVFEYHPDHGGSLEEFMRLKKARDQVQRYVEKN